MKGFYTSIVFILCACVASAQFENYTHKFFNAEYKELENATVAFGNKSWKDTMPDFQAEFVDSVRFNFPFATKNLYRVAFSFRAVQAYVMTADFSYQLLPGFAPLWLKEPSDVPPFLSKFSYVIDTVGSISIFKGQYSNYGVCDRNYTLRGTLNMQIWLYENGVIEWRFGQITANDTLRRNYSTTRFKLMANYTNNVQQFTTTYAMFGPFDSPKGVFGYGGFLSDYADSGLSVFPPPAGTVYRLYPKNLTSVQTTLPNEELSLYPNPAQDKFYLNNDMHLTQVELISITGAQHYVLPYTGCADVSSVAEGLYIVRFTDKEGSLHHRKIQIRR
ncbi:MAG: T9SS type A sorting domain-containing protein [Bacteroidota bacterium]|jgi:hypothetical protein